MAGPSVIETKVVASSWTAVVSGLCTWALVTYIPTFHNGIPSPLDAFIPFIVATICSTAAGYFAKHTPRQEETVKAAFQVFNDPKVLAEMEKFVRTEEGQATLRTAHVGEHAKELPYPRDAWHASDDTRRAYKYLDYSQCACLQKHCARYRCRWCCTRRRCATRMLCHYICWPLW